LGIHTEDVLVASTGVIGVPLPVEKACAGIAAACAALGSDEAAGDAAAEAIMTTDTKKKQIAVEVDIAGKQVTIGGMAKGSGMIHPNMATMLAFVTTDAAIDPAALRHLLPETVADSFNMISVDGDTSTNDSLMVLANGVAGNPVLTLDHPDFPKFREAFRFVNVRLAKSIVADGEGATKLLEVRVRGARTDVDARMLVKSILTSNLVKTAFFGEDANWGRILAAMGYSGATFGLAGVKIEFASEGGRVTLMSDGEPEPFDEAQAKQVLQAREIQVEVTLTDGIAEAVGWGCDLSYDYVRINGDYRT
ncbi:MAG: bifunctional glutamate N-acetyltransferase/amino-acid acetyltransferase ArgJ, partial [Alicyclobacillus sp.]|nr:bifunctional glutamate N-acetyltransferase/amino-acid acetyltransferase ArgJ [Alicyclobacillus sp.]